MNSVTERFSLKDHLFNQEKVRKIADEIASAYPEFATQKFVKAVVEGFPDRELMERLYLVRDCLREFLPSEYRTAVQILLESLPPANDPALTDNDFGDFIYGPYGSFVAEYGATEADLDFSLTALYEITKRFSVEFPIRAFLNTFPKETLKKLALWSKDSNYHVRRLVSEGTRPKLPWAQSIDIDYKKPLAFLDTLHADKTRYVTRSVANHMNDIAKRDPKRAVATLKRWQREGKQTEKELSYMVRHSLRTLVKDGNPQALALLGYTEPKIATPALSVHTPTVTLGDQLAFSVTIQSRSTSSQPLLIDYSVYFLKADGTRSAKTFKLKQLTLAPKQSVTLHKKHRLKLMTTKKLYLGTQAIEPQVNGKKYSKTSFDLVE